MWNGRCGIKHKAEGQDKLYFCSAAIHALYLGTYKVGVGDL